MQRRLIVTFCALLAACGPTTGGTGSSTDSGPVQHEEADAGPGETPDAGAREPAIVFTAMRAGVPTPVDAITYSEPVNIVFTGLVPHERVLIQGKLWGYASYAQFEVGDDGNVDVSRDAPLQGSYSGVDPDGLFWSMEKLSDTSGTTYDVELSVQRDADVVVERRLIRYPMGHDATMREVREMGLVGTLMVPPGDPRPVVVVVGGSEGGLDGALFSAAHVETMGYAVLALAYFGTDGVPAQLTEIPLEYFGTAFEWLKTQSDVDGSRIVFMGGSRGGELALLVGSTFPGDVDAVIAHVGSGLVFGSTADEIHSAWSLAGTPVPFLQLPSNIEPVVETLPDGHTGHRWAPATEQAIRGMDPSAVDPSRIHVENIAGPVLIVAAGDDGLWPSCFLSQQAFDRLTSTGHVAQHGDTFECFPNAGHLFGTPGWPTAESSTTTAFGELTILGGTPEGNGRASRLYDQRIRDFLARVAP